MIGLGAIGIGGKELPLDTVNNQGLVYWLGTQRGAAAFSNPHNLGWVTASWIGNGTGTPDLTVDRLGSSNVHTSSTTNSWWKIDIGTNNANRRLNATYMRCQNRTGYSDQVPQYATISGSNDDTNWTALGSISPGFWNGTASTWNTITLNPLVGSFRYFRYQFTSTNSNGAWYICIQEYELFGLLSE